jgi:hypothetical protein
MMQHLLFDREGSRLLRTLKLENDLLGNPELKPDTAYELLALALQRSYCIPKLDIKRVESVGNVNRMAPACHNSIQVPRKFWPNGLEPESPVEGVSHVSMEEQQSVVGAGRRQSMEPMEGKPLTPVRTGESPVNTNQRWDSLFVAPCVLVTMHVQL